MDHGDPEGRGGRKQPGGQAGNLGEVQGNEGRPRVVELALDDHRRIDPNQIRGNVLLHGEQEELLWIVGGGPAGPIDFDEYRRPVDRLAKSDIEAVTRPVTREEEAIIFGSEYRLSFGGDKIARIDKAVLGGLGGTVRTEQIGAGKLVYAALPFELADGIEPTIALYEFALKQAMVQPPFMMEKPEPGVLIRPLAFKDAILYCAVSETDADKELSFTDNATGKGLTVRVPAQRAVMLLLGRDGRVLAQYGECVQS